MARFALPLLLAPALLITGCQSNQSADSARSTAAIQPSMTVTGCLQEAGNGTYLLTRVNSTPPVPKTVGTSGASNAIERDQVRDAENSYRISPAKGIALPALLGKEVRVTGTLAAKGELPAMPAVNQAPAALPNITPHELSRIDASAVAFISDECGNRQP